ncbi:MAG: hypothetical protein IIT39_03110 [Clostridia bacterium]|nr:hypothetical protein [Clostridia bacterium]
MKKYESDRFRAMNMYGYGYLMTNSETLEGVKKEIDESRKRQMRLGYKPDTYIITHEERYLYTDDDGRFVKSETLEQAVEIYPSIP